MSRRAILAVIGVTAVIAGALAAVIQLAGGGHPLHSGRAASNPAAACPRSARLLSSWNNASSLTRQTWAAPGSGFTDITCWDNWVVASPEASRAGDFFLFSYNNNALLLSSYYISYPEFMTDVCSSRRPVPQRAAEIANCGGK